MRNQFINGSHCSRITQDSQRHVKFYNRKGTTCSGNMSAEPSLPFLRLSVQAVREPKNAEKNKSKSIQHTKTFISRMCAGAHSPRSRGHRLRAKIMHPSSVSDWQTVKVNSGFSLETAMALTAMLSATARFAGDVKYFRRTANNACSYNTKWNRCTPIMLPSNALFARLFRSSDIGKYKEAHSRLVTSVALQRIVHANNGTLYTDSR